MGTLGFGGGAGLGGACGGGCVLPLPRGICSAAVKSRSEAGSREAGFAAGLGAAPAFAAPAVPADTSRMKPPLSSCWTSFSNSPSKLLPTFCATSASVARPSIAESTARSGRERWLVLPAASCTPLPDFE
jgi:hypothetical protein